MESSTHGRVVIPGLEPVHWASVNAVAAEEAEEAAVVQVVFGVRKEGERFASGEACHLD